MKPFELVKPDSLAEASRRAAEPNALIKAAGIDVIDRLKEEGIRQDLIVVVGGAPVNEAFAEAVGADAYGEDAAVAVETAKKLMAIRRGDLAPE